MHEDRIALTQQLAAALWRSAAPSRGRALDHWLAAEQMVAGSESAARTADLPEADKARRPARSLASSAFPVDHVRALAHQFWAGNGPSTDGSLGFWLAAERHVQAICGAALAGSYDVAEAFSASNHWTRIRERAEQMWHDEGRCSGRDLEIWLRAERQILSDIGGRRDKRVAPGEDAAVAASSLTVQGSPSEPRLN